MGKAYRAHDSQLERSRRKVFPTSPKRVAWGSPRDCSLNHPNIYTLHVTGLGREGPIRSKALVYTSVNTSGEPTNQS